jgi:hypothetical protein
MPVTFKSAAEYLKIDINEIYCKQTLLNWNMKRIGLLLMVTICLMSGNLFAQFGKKVVGNNKYVSINHKVESYNKIVVSHVQANVVYKNNPDSAGFVNIYGEENIVHLLDVSTKKQTLSIKNINAANTEHGLLMIYVYSPDIENIDITGAVIFETSEPLKRLNMKLAISGSGQIKIRNLECTTLKVSLLTGSGDVLVKGKADEASFSVVGGGEIRADNLVAQTAKCKLIGNGNIGCHATKLLKATITGVGNIYYSGNPEVKSTIIGTGNVKPLQ